MATVNGTASQDLINLSGRFVRVGSVWVLIDSGTTTTADRVYALDGDDEVDGEGGNDSINGESGNDLLIGGTGNDTVDGGNGNDVLYGGDGNDKLYGEAGNDTLQGDAGNDELHGGNDDDALYGGDGNDKLYGEAGNDTLQGDAGNDELRGGDDDDALYGGDGNDKLYGEAGNDTLQGDAGNDELRGGDDDDALYGGDGNDKLYGEAGNDTLQGDAGNDELRGGDDDDALYGGDGNDKLYGEAGNDTLQGDAGNDELRGGDDDDALYGGDGNDKLYGEAGNDTLQGDAGNDELRGGDDDDALYGGDGNDKLYGDSGNDRLTGGIGADSLDGGLGADVYVYNTVAESQASASHGFSSSTGDFIDSFDSAEQTANPLQRDTIDLGALASSIGHALGWSGKTASAWGVWYSTTSSTTLISIDTSGDALANMVIKISSKETLGAVDFLLGATPPAAPTIDLDTASDTGLSETDNITSDTTLSLSGTAQANTTIKVYEGVTLLGITTASGAGAWNFTTGVLADEVSLTATATDAAGNVSGASEALAVTIDTDGPGAPTVALAVDGATVAVAPAEAGGTIEYSTDEGANWTGSFSAAGGVNSVQVRQVDVAGNPGAVTPFSFHVGDAESNTLQGGAQNDLIDGGGGNDTLGGGEGNDEIAGGPGDDDIDGGPGDDTILYAFGDGKDTIQGGGGIDTLEIRGAPYTAVNLTANGDVIEFEGGTITGIDEICSTFPVHPVPFTSPSRATSRPRAWHPRRSPSREPRRTTCSMRVA